MGEIATHDAGRPPADDAHVQRSLTADSGLAGRAVRWPRGRALEQLDRGRSRAVERFGVGEDSSQVRPVHFFHRCEPGWSTTLDPLLAPPLLIYIAPWVGENHGGHAARHGVLAPGCVCFLYMICIFNIFENVKKKVIKNIVCTSLCPTCI
jgi:hypothetical protein